MSDRLPIIDLIRCWLFELLLGLAFWVHPADFNEEERSDIDALAAGEVKK